MSNKQNDFFIPSSLEQWRAIFQQCPSGIAACDVDGSYLFANPAYAAIYGYEPCELRGKNFMEVKTDSAKQPVQTKLLSDILENKPDVDVFEKLDKQRDGTEILVRYKNEYLCDEDGKAYGALVFVQDVTTENKLRVKLNKLETRIKAGGKFETLGRIAGGVVHDFNNRLNVVLGTASLLQRQADLDADTEEMLEDVVSAARQAAELTSKLLLFSRESTVHPTRCSLSEISGNAVSLVKRITVQPIQWHIQKCSFDTTLYADKISVQNAIFNILLNAVEAMPEKGDVHVAYSKDLINGCACTSVVIRDTGCGMSSQVLSKVFDPLFSTKLSKKGTGLGLGAARQGVEDNGGTIEIESQLNDGTEVTITFPEVQADNPDAELNPFVYGTTTRQYSVLVVDDEEDVLKSTKRMLESLGHKATVFVEATQAREWYCRHYMEIDLLLLDVMLPGMTGIDLMKELSEINPGTPVILMSGYALKDSIEDALSSSATTFTRKPFDVNELSQAINSQSDKTVL